MQSELTTLGLLRESAWGQKPLLGRSVKDELRANLVRKMTAREPILPDVVGYDDTVVPALSNALLSRHNFILLGLRGQAKSRILRSLVGLLDEAVPAIAGCEVNDDPFRPICPACLRRVAEEGDETPIDWLERGQRFVEKLATPDVTVADIIGDIDPIRAAHSGRALSDALNMHFGLLPRSNRGIFGLNELPDLAGKVQVALFNVMQEGDVQLKGYPIRLPLDVAIVFTANPEDYTARGKIITPLKDRIGSEIRTHYPAALEIGMKITRAEAWVERQGVEVEIPPVILEIVEGIAFAARGDSRVDKRSGVSQRLPISCLEDVISNAERRSLTNGHSPARIRIGDVYAALPAITGKIELEYEGELKGPETIANELIAGSVGRAFDRRVREADAEPIVAWFEAGGMLKMDDDVSAASWLTELDTVTGLNALARRIAGDEAANREAVATAAELVLEGLFGLKKISRSADKLYMKAEPVLDATYERPMFNDDLMQ